MRGRRGKEAIDRAVGGSPRAPGSGSLGHAGSGGV